VGFTITVALGTLTGSSTVVSGVLKREQASISNRQAAQATKIFEVLYRDFIGAPFWGIGS
jgi:hypothetical protein